jgi:hypothetical protein
MYLVGANLTLQLLIANLKTIQICTFNNTFNTYNLLFQLIQNHL